MKLRNEDLGSHRRDERKNTRNSSFGLWLFILALAVGGGVFLYSQRAVLPPQIKEPVRAAIAYFQDFWDELAQRPQASEQGIIDIEQDNKDYVTRAEIQEFINRNFATLTDKVDKLQNDVEYVGGLGRSLTRKVNTVEQKMPALEKNVAVLRNDVTVALRNDIVALNERLEPLQVSIRQQEQKLRDIGIRLEETDTLLQAEMEKSANNFRAVNEKFPTLNEGLANLRETINSMRSASDAQQRTIAQLEQTITILNGRLVELER